MCGGLIMKNKFTTDPIVDHRRQLTKSDLSAQEFIEQRLGLEFQLENNALYQRLKKDQEGQNRREVLLLL